MKAIQTKYLPATDRRGSRIKAFDLDGNSITIPYPLDVGGIEKCHELAVRALMDKKGWKGKLAFGEIKGGMVYCFVEKYIGFAVTNHHTFEHPDPDDNLS